MTLLSLEKAEEYFSISDIVDGDFSLNYIIQVIYKVYVLKAEEGPLLIGEYFTSGSDFKVENSFIWCTSNNSTVTSPIWAPGKPGDKTGTENCITINTSVGKMSDLSDKSCTTASKYICEVLNSNY